MTSSQSGPDGVGVTGGTYGRSVTVRVAASVMTEPSAPWMAHSYRYPLMPTVVPATVSDAPFAPSILVQVTPSSVLRYHW